MKRSDMNAHQKVMFDLMDSWTSDIIGGYENQMDDYEEGTEEYEKAESFLSMDHEDMVEYFYNLVMQDCGAGSNAEHARFAGKQFLLDRIEARLTKWGY